jgi:hypothetical protein
MSRIMLVLWGISIGLVLAAPLNAQVPARSVRLSVDTSFVRYHVGGWNPAGPEDWLVQKLEAGVGNPNAAIGLGVTVVDALAIGLRFLIAYETEALTFDQEDSGAEQPSNFDNRKYSYLRWGILPYLEYAFLKKTIRPFIMVTLGFEGNKAENAADIQSFWDFVFEAGGGLHFFASPAVSVDATVLLGFSAGGGKREPANPPEDAEPQTQRFTRILFRATGILGVSGWF